MASKTAVMMKIPPNKPHFFKPILPNFKNGIKIPIAFLKYLNGCNQEHAILRRAGKKWEVKVNGRLMEEGWGKFVEEHALKAGDILVFRHEGNMEFEVSIFDSNHFKRGHEGHLEGEKVETDHTCKKFTSQANTKEKPKRNIKSSQKVCPTAEAAKDMILSLPHCICIIRPYVLKRNFLQLPASFARENGLRNKRCMITINDEQRSWTFELRSSGRHTNIGGAWIKFCEENCLKVEDQMKFEIVANGENPVLRFYGLRANASIQPEEEMPKVGSKRTSTQDMPAPKAQVLDSTSAKANRHFISTITRYSITRSILYLPARFAKSNGLRNKQCEIILIDRKRRQWPVQLGTQGHHVAITKGWEACRKANNVQVGDTYKFELISNGKSPKANFHCKYIGKDVKRRKVSH